MYGLEINTEDVFEDFHLLDHLNQYSVINLGLIVFNVFI